MKKPLLTRQQIEKLMILKLKRDAKYFKKYGIDDALKQTLEKIEKRSFRHALNLTFKVRSGKFGIKNLDFDPETGLGNSYQWYNITRVFKGKLVLNTFRYSVTTGKHVWMLRSFLKDLGLEFEKIEAPRGLQDAQAAKRQTLYVLASQAVKLHYSREKTKLPTFSEIKRRSEFKTLKLMGESVTLDDWVNALNDAEKSRRKRLEMLKVKNQIRKIPVELVEKLPDTIDPLTLVEKYSSGWAASTGKDRAKREAHAQGKTKVIQYIEKESNNA